MRIRELFELGEAYLILGIAVVFLVFMIAVLFRKFIWKRQEKIDRKTWVLNGILLCYLVVVLGVTLLDRGAFGGKLIYWAFFLQYSLKELN